MNRDYLSTSVIVLFTQEIFETREYQNNCINQPPIESNTETSIKYYIDRIVDFVCVCVCVCIFASPSTIYCIAYNLPHPTKFEMYILTNNQMAK